MDKLTFGVRGGELVGVIGPNGAGKALSSTFSRINCPESGKIVLGEKDTRFLSAECGHKKWLWFSGNSQNLELTSQSNSHGEIPHIGRWQREGDVDEEKVSWAMEITSTAVFSDRLFSELSGGEKQRVMIARALAQEPELLLLDEPTSHLDVLHQLEIMDILLDLRAAGVAIVSVFHDLNLVSQFCDNALLLKEGRCSLLGGWNK